MTESEHDWEVARARLEVAEDMGLILASFIALFLSTLLDSLWLLVLIIPFYWMIKRPYEKQEKATFSEYMDEVNSGDAE